MDAHLLAIVLRETERLLVVGGGVLSVVLGYRLFIALPRLEPGGTGQLQLPGGVSIYLSRIGPGVFFALFGAGVMVFALRASVTVVGGAPAASGGAVPAAATHYSGMTATGTVADAESLQAQRSRVVGTVRGLRSIEASLRSASPGPDRDDALRVLDDAKVALMRGVWHEPDWGRLDEFEAWRNAGMNAAPPRSIAQAVQILNGAKP